MDYEAARDLLFRLDPERAHELSLALFARMPGLATRPFRQPIPRAPTQAFGLQFRNPVGLAAGLDKNGEAIAAWDRLGFGFVEVGTVTPRPQPGNPRPRLFRIPEHKALINRLGFNNKGVDHLVAQVRATPRSCVLGINIGKNADTPVERAVEDYEICLRKTHAVADYITVNISSPNTRNLRDLQGQEALDALLRRLAQVREELAQQEGRRKPLLLKIAPDLDESQLSAIADTVRRHGVDGLIATNTTLQRPGLEDYPDLAGGLSGRPLRPIAQQILLQLRRALGPDYPLVGVGGIMDGAAAAERRAAGAQLLQIYSGFIYQGPRLLRECVEAFLPGASAIR